MKTYLLIATCLATFSSFAQKAGKQLEIFNSSDRTEITKFFPLKKIELKSAPLPLKLSLTQTAIGSTYYDLQTNGSTGDRLVRYGNNELSASWIFGMQFPSFPDRGTGYNYFNGNTWLNPPSARIEPVTANLTEHKTGYPSTSVTASGKEHNIAHMYPNDSLIYSHRQTAGSGSWNYSYITGQSIGHKILWTRLTSGGLDGNSLHMLSVTTPVANLGTPYLGIDGAMVYSRSQDNGVTWDKLFEILPGIDSTIYRSMGADAYAIHARGNTIAVVAGSYFTDWALWKSTDNGDTWTKTVIHEFAFPAYDLDGSGTKTDVDSDGVGDLVATTDGKVAVLIDQNGIVHTWAGALAVMDDDTTTGANTFFWTPTLDALIYWNENFGAGTPPDTIASSVDYNGDGEFNFAPDGIPSYRGSMTSQPSAGIDINGNIYVAYMSPVEGATSGSTGPGTANDFNFRNIYLIASTNNGVSWSNPFNVSNDIYIESVYPTIPKDVRTDCIDIIWQQDFRPDIAGAGNPLHPFDFNNINYIIHDCISTQLLLEINENTIKNISDVTAYPNPATDQVKINYNVTEATEIKVEILNSMGQRLMVQNHNAIAPGIHSLDIDIRSLPSGIYFVNSIAGGENIASKFVKR